MPVMALATSSAQTGFPVRHTATQHSAHLRPSYAYAPPPMQVPLRPSPQVAPTYPPKIQFTIPKQREVVTGYPVPRHISGASYLLATGTAGQPQPDSHRQSHPQGPAHSVSNGVQTSGKKVHSPAPPHPISSTSQNQPQARQLASNHSVLSGKSSQAITHSTSLIYELILRHRADAARDASVQRDHLAREYQRLHLTAGALARECKKKLAEAEAERERCRCGARGRNGVKQEEASPSYQQHATPRSHPSTSSFQQLELENIHLKSELLTLHAELKFAREEAEKWKSCMSELIDKYRLRGDTRKVDVEVDENSGQLDTDAAGTSSRRWSFHELVDSVSVDRGGNMTDADADAEGSSTKPHYNLAKMPMMHRRGPKPILQPIVTQNLERVQTHASMPPLPGPNRPMRTLVYNQQRSQDANANIQTRSAPPVVPSMRTQDHHWPMPPPPHLTYPYLGPHPPPYTTHLASAQTQNQTQAHVPFLLPTPTSAPPVYTLAHHGHPPPRHHAPMTPQTGTPTRAATHQHPPRPVPTSAPALNPTWTSSSLAPAQSPVLDPAQSSVSVPRKRAIDTDDLPTWTTLATSSPHPRSRESDPLLNNATQADAVGSSYATAVSDPETQVWQNMNRVASMSFSRKRPRLGDSGLVGGMFTHDPVERRGMGSERSDGHGVVKVKSESEW